MSSKRKYVEYLWDPTCKIPTRSKYRMKQAAASADTGCANNETEDEDEPCTSDQGSRNCLEGAAQPRNVEPTSVQEILPTETEASEPRVSGVGLLASNATLEGNNDDSSDSSSDDTDAETEADGDDAADAPGKEISDLDQPIYPSARITKAESMLMVMAHSLRHDQSKEATESLLKIISMHLPEGTPFPANEVLVLQELFCCRVVLGQALLLLSLLCLHWGG
ncbi:hypothetical protein HPB48_026254 [Haemaphysalis longicornis]|uniref:Uncharacterized protein n=1 Tax=Haemaphysalis longicornis TaxID=44386 RepID=A0A9J6HBZ2_HAELO|nr:hypothetical protein HPB48_026254 [Haemaphysalis longicornis]